MRCIFGIRWELLRFALPGALPAALVEIVQGIVLDVVSGHGFGVQSPVELLPGYDVKFVMSTEVRTGNV